MEVDTTPSATSMSYVTVLTNLNFVSVHVCCLDAWLTIMANNFQVGATLTATPCLLLARLSVYVASVICFRLCTAKPATNLYYCDNHC